MTCMLYLGVTALSTHRRKQVSTEREASSTGTATLMVKRERGTLSIGAPGTLTAGARGDIG